MPQLNYFATRHDHLTSSNRLTHRNYSHWLNISIITAIADTNDRIGFGIACVKGIADGERFIVV